MSEWHTTDTLPLDQDVLVWNGETVQSAYCDRKGDFWTAVQWVDDVTHWMSLPKPPYTRADYDAAPEDGSRYR